MIACWCAAVGTLLVACRPADPPPTPGKVSLEFVSMSGSDAEFRLGNGTSRTIGIVGTHSLVSGFDFWIICNDGISNNLPSELGWGERDAVLPGKTMRVVINGAFEKGARCLVQLKLKDGTRIDSNEFQP